MQYQTFVIRNILLILVTVFLILEIKLEKTDETKINKVIEVVNKSTSIISDFFEYVDNLESLEGCKEKVPHPRQANV